MLPAEYQGYIWNCYRERFKTVWITGDAGVGKTYLLKEIAKSVHDSFYYSFSDGIDGFKKIAGITEEKKNTDVPASEAVTHFDHFVEMNPKVDSPWFEDAVEKLAENHSMIILDNFETMFGYWNNRLWKVAEAQKRIHKKPVLLVIVSRLPMVMHPVFSMWIFSSKDNERIKIYPAGIKKSVMAVIYRNPKEAILDCAVTGYLPPYYPNENYEDHHNWHENILHLLEYRNFRLSDILKDIPDDKKEACGNVMRSIALSENIKQSSVEEEIALLEKANLIKHADGYDFGSHKLKKLAGWKCTDINKDFFFRFIYDYHQKNPMYVTQDELEVYYQANIAPNFVSYAESLCTRLIYTGNYRRCPVQCIKKVGGRITELAGYVVQENDKWKNLTLCDFDLSDEPYSFAKFEHLMNEKAKLTSDWFPVSVHSFIGFDPKLNKKIASDGLKAEFSETIFGIKCLTIIKGD